MKYAKIGLFVISALSFHPSSFAFFHHGYGWGYHPFHHWGYYDAWDEPFPRPIYDDRPSFDSQRLNEITVLQTEISNLKTEESLHPLKRREYDSIIAERYRQIHSLEMLP